MQSVYRMKSIGVIFFILTFFALTQIVDSPLNKGSATISAAEMVADPFVRNLRLGDIGEDVRQLQIQLNSDLKTQVSVEGAGAPGNETTYFGARTVAAVKKFQELYSREILIPAGLVRGSGFFGPLTRAKMQTFIAKKVADPLSSPSDVPTQIQRPQILSISPAVITGSPQEVIITGVNFSPTGNTVFISSEGPDAFSSLASEDGKTIRFPFRFKIGETLKRDLKRAAPDPDAYNQLVDVVSNNTQERLDGFATAHIAVVVVVRNSNGESEPKQLIIDITSILKEQ